MHFRFGHPPKYLCAYTVAQFSFRLFLVTFGGGQALVALAWCSALHSRGDLSLAHYDGSRQYPTAALGA